MANQWIRANRRDKPLAELRRKARKARRRGGIWTVEELDLAAARAEILKGFSAKIVNWPGDNLDPASLRQRLRGNKISCSPWRIYRGVVREFCISAKCLFANRGVPYDVIEMELKSEGWLYENENLLDVLRYDRNLKRGLSITDPGMDTFGAIPEDWTEDDYNANF